jgi:hypothetical protein
LKIISSGQKNEWLLDLLSICEGPVESAESLQDLIAMGAHKNERALSCLRYY